MQTFASPMIDTAGVHAPHLAARRLAASPADDLNAVQTDLLQSVLNLASATSVETAGFQLCHQVREKLSAQTVLLSLKQRRRYGLAGISDSPTFDAHGEVALTANALCKEESPNLRRRLLDLLSGTDVSVIPLTSAESDDGTGKQVGSLIVVHNSQTKTNRLSVLEKMKSDIAGQLDLLQRAQRRWLPQSLTRRMANQSGRRIAIFAGLAITALLMCPWPYRIGCDCELQPLQRRFVAAPFAGRLDSVAVQPGDIVESGTLLARCDRREIELELQTQEAEHRQAKKRRDAALASGRVADAQLAKLEIQRVQARISLLQRRLEHIDIKSPVAGVVVHGDLQRSVGAPVETGQNLFEIAPLDKMVIQMLVPESDVLEVVPGQRVNVRFNATPGRSWSGEVRRVRPRAEILNGQNVFVAEVELPNEEQLLRPGMKGQGVIYGSFRTLGWSWFHKTWNSTAMWMGW